MRPKFRPKVFLWFLCYLLALPLMYGQVKQLFAAVESPPEGIWGDPHIGIVLDTTDTMGPEISVLTTAWGDAQMNNVPATFQLTAFKDAANFVGSTMSAAQMQTWLGEQTAAGGGDCEDAALVGLLTGAAQQPAGDRPAGHLLLVTDATPAGNRAQLVYTVDRLLRRGVRATTLLTDWCPGAQIGPAAAGFISAATGGKAYPSDATFFYTDTLIALQSLKTADVIDSIMGTVTPGNPQIFPLLVDGSMTTLGVEDDYYN